MRALPRRGGFLDSRKNENGDESGRMKRKSVLLGDIGFQYNEQAKDGMADISVVSSKSIEVNLLGSF